MIVVYVHGLPRQRDQDATGRQLKPRHQTACPAGQARTGVHGARRIVFALSSRQVRTGVYPRHGTDEG